MPTDRPSNRPLVAVSTSSFGVVSEEPIARLEGAGVEVRVNPHGRRLEGSEIDALLSRAVALIAGTEPLDRKVLQAAPQLRLIARCGTGLDNVDLEAARELGIEVRSAPDSHVDAVAELTLAGILDVLRSVAAADRALRVGALRRPMGRLLRGKTVGLVGLGRVGRALVLLLAPFHVRILAHEPTPGEEFVREHDIRLLPLDDVIAGAEVLSLHLPLSNATRHLLDRRRLELMPSGAILVNCSRGGLVDECALFDLLESGRIAGAFLDTFEREPYRGPLTTLETVLLTPHIGSYAVESRLRMELQAVEHVLTFLQAAEP